MAKRHWRQHVKHLPETLRKISERLLHQSEQYPEPAENDNGLQIQALRTCLEKLSPENRQLIESLYFDQISYQDIGLAIGSSREAVYTRMCRIRTALYECIQKVMELEVRDE